jgi:hypothetical protein
MRNEHKILDGEPERKSPVDNINMNLTGLHCWECSLDSTGSVWGPVAYSYETFGFQIRDRFPWLAEGLLDS